LNSGKYRTILPLLLKRVIFKDKRVQNSSTLIPQYPSKQFHSRKHTYFRAVNVDFQQLGREGKNQAKPPVKLTATCKDGNPSMGQRAQVRVPAASTAIRPVIFENAEVPFPA